MTEATLMGAKLYRLDIQNTLYRIQNDVDHLRTLIGRDSNDDRVIELRKLRECLQNLVSMFGGTI